MPEYIDRDKTIEEFKTCGAVFTYGVDVCNGVISRLLIQPAADVAPVVHGKWENSKYMAATKCGVCGEDIFLDYCEQFLEWKYCPICGAKMDLEE